MSGGNAEQITVFTTRPDTIFGMTYVVLAPEHPLVEKLTTEEQKPKVTAYRDTTRRKSELERLAAGAKEKTGVFTGAYAVNPINGEQVPIWIADYVLLTYGSGAIMAVPAHDERDFEFAKAFALPIRQVIAPAGQEVHQLAIVDSYLARLTDMDEETIIYNFLRQLAAVVDDFPPVRARDGAIGPGGDDFGVARSLADSVTLEAPSVCAASTPLSKPRLSRSS